MKSSVNPFINLNKDAIISSSLHFHIIKDKFPVSPLHLLIISKREVLDYFELTEEEKNDLNQAITLAKNQIELISIPDGYNIGMNCGSAAGQTVFHFHCHVIPRFKGDMIDPRGGVRHCVEGKGYY